MEIDIEIEDNITPALRGLKDKMSDMTPVMNEIGAAMLSSTLLRFVDQTSPAGVPWATLSTTTLARRRQRGNGAKILRDTGRLMNSITYNAGPDFVEIGTNVIYGSTHQFGATKGQYGTTRKGAPIPWGDIPGRPFLGASDEDIQTIMAIVNTYLTEATEDNA